MGVERNFDPLHLEWSSLPHDESYVVVKELVKLAHRDFELTFLARWGLY